jgi:hypothetical protein
VLVWRNKKRQEEGERHRKQRKATHHHPIMHQHGDPGCKIAVKTSLHPEACESTGRVVSPCVKGTTWP